ncbi:hypothetical protein Vretimale_15113 [Volvox reticuliferus]|uniref:RAP domain-containing protein n=1 Tax=Volvox reticuliferus TaxID=1737510 RepID=A0A8J4LVZ3_9CHLO|nr:hypothetical protein Vretifemale_5307 [Volvox reticuliferus]GIM11628.1 hypothetical protein Vretimale_15113 [Volvox reticuliferus]
MATCSLNTGRQGCLHVPIGGCSASCSSLDFLPRTCRKSYSFLRCVSRQLGRASRMQFGDMAAGGEAKDLGLRGGDGSRLPRRNDGKYYAATKQGRMPERPSLPTASALATQVPMFQANVSSATSEDTAIPDSQSRRVDKERRVASAGAGARGAVAACEHDATGAGTTGQGRDRRRQKRRFRAWQSNISVTSGTLGGHLPDVSQHHPCQHKVEPDTQLARLFPAEIPDGTPSMSTSRQEIHMVGRSQLATGVPGGAAPAVGAEAVPCQGNAELAAEVGTMAVECGRQGSGDGTEGCTEEQRPLPSVSVLSPLPASRMATAPKPATDSGGSGNGSGLRHGRSKGPVRHLLRHRGPEGSRTRAPSQSSSMHPHLLTGILRTASSVPKLQKYIARYGSQFNNLHVCCCLNRLAKAPDARSPAQRETVQQLLADLGDMLVPLLPDCDARELCNVLWVWGKLGHIPKPETWEAMRITLFGVDPAEVVKAVTPTQFVPSSVPDCAAAAGPASVLLPPSPSSPALVGPEADESLPASGVRTEERSDTRTWRWGQVADRPAPGIARAAAGPDGDSAGLPALNLSVMVTDCNGLTSRTPLNVDARRQQPLPPPGDVRSSGNGLFGADTAVSASTAVTDEEPAPSAAAAAAVGGKLEQAAPQGLANAAWALARLECKDPWAWRRLAECSLSKLHAFIPYDISNLSYAFVLARQHRAHPAHEELMCALAAAAESRLTEFCPQDISNMLWAYARAGMAQPALFAAAAPIARLMAADFGQAGLVQVLWAYAAMRVYDAPLLGALAHKMLPQLHFHDVNSRVMMCWALARFVAAVSGRGSTAGATAAAGCISLFSAARVRAGFVDPLIRLHLTGGQAAVAAATTAAAAAVTAQGGDSDSSGGSWRPGDGASHPRWSTSSISTATLARAYVEDLTMCGGGGSANSSNSTAATSATTLPVDWAVDILEQEGGSECGGVGYDSFADVGSDRPHAAAAAAASLAQSQVEAYAAASAAAHAVLSEMPPQLLPALCESLRPQIGTLETGSLAVFMWALATLGHVDTDLFTAAADVLATRLRRGEVLTQYLTHTAWAFTVAGVYNSELYDSLAAAAAGLCATGPSAATSLALSNVLWALGNAGHYDAELYGNAGRAVAAVAAAATSTAAGAAANPPGADVHDAVNRLALVMLACAYAGHVDPELYSMVSEVLRRAGARALGDNSLANICWALAVVDHADLDLLSDLFGDAARRDTAALGVRGCTQLFHCALWLQDLVPGGSQVVALLPRDVWEVGRANFMELAKDPYVSDFQAYVFNALDSMRLSPSLETKTSDQLFSLDVAVSLGGDSGGALRVAVEANGPQHYLRTHPSALEGSTLLRSRLLRARGLVPLHVHWREWQDLGGDVLRQRRYLRAKLRELMHQEQQALRRQEERLEEQLQAAGAGPGLGLLLLDSRDWADIGPAAERSADGGSGGFSTDGAPGFAVWEEALPASVADRHGTARAAAAGRSAATRRRTLTLSSESQVLSADPSEAQRRLPEAATRQALEP